MPRLAVVYLLLAAAFLFFLSISRAPHSPRHHRTRRLFHFDPFINQLERQAEKKGLLDQQSFHEEYDKFWENYNPDKFDGEIDIFGESQRLNVTERLIYLFPLLDCDPKDGAITFRELEAWMHKQAHERLDYETEREIDTHDKDDDGEITLHEYLNYSPNEEIDWSNMEREKPGWWREKFRIADGDGNGSLNSTEFNHFLHPEDSGNPKLQLWLLNEKIRDIDRDDGKLNFDEFRSEAHKIHGFFESPDTGNYRHPFDDGSNTEQKFHELDTNKDNLLTAEELMPIIQHLYPSGELAYASLQTNQLIKETDDDNDGKLTLKEMLNHHQAFYSMVYNEEDYDEEDDYFNDYHYELRK